MAYIYKIINKINGKLYIGRTEVSIARRFREHLIEARSGRSNHRPLYRAINKYGHENFTVELIEETPYPGEREIYWISKLGTFSKGYNATLGGEGEYRIDRELVIDTYNELKTAKATAQFLNHDFGLICKILRDSGIELSGNAKSSIRKPVVCIETGVVFDSATSASEFLVRTLNKNCKPQIYATHISACCRGKRKRVFGYSFSFIDLSVAQPG